MGFAEIHVLSRTPTFSFEEAEMEEGSNGVEKTNKIEALSVETDGVKIQAQEHVVNSAHTIDQGQCFKPF